MRAPELAAAAEACVRGLRLVGPWCRLGGNVNLVWRVGTGEGESVIVKHAPPHVATVPELALSPRRLVFEASALQLVGEEGELAACARGLLRVPRVLGADSERAVLVLEDLGPVPDLGTALAERPELAARLGDVGTALGRLHSGTAERPDLARRFDNADVQATRAQVQYEGAGALLAAADIQDAAALGERTTALGRALRERGRCLVMGDLWPGSLLALDDPSASGPALGLIDWEFVHYGRPLQDVAHLAAHLWMHLDRAGSCQAVAALEEGLGAFLDGYAEEAASAPRLFDEAELRDAGVHLGCEILMRTLGPFQASSVYAGLSHDDPGLLHAVEAATAYLRGAGESGMLAPLRRLCASAAAPPRIQSG